MAKLTEKQAKVLQYTLKYGRIHIHDAIMSVGRGSNLPGTINALVKRGYLKEDYPSLYYLLTDEGYAIAQPAAAPTVNAADVGERRNAEVAFGGVQNIKAGDHVRIKSGCDFSDHAEQEELETLRDCNIVGVAVHDAAPPFALSVDFGKPFGRFSMGLNQIVQTPPDPRDAQIAALTRDLADAVGERDALRKRIAFMRRDAHFMVKTQYPLDRYEIDAAFESIMAFADGKHPELNMPDPAERSESQRIIDEYHEHQADKAKLHHMPPNADSTMREALRLLMWEDDYAICEKDGENLPTAIPYEVATALIGRGFAEYDGGADYLHITEAGREWHADAAMVAALKAHDNGNRTSADNVLAMFADDDEGTIA